MKTLLYNSKVFLKADKFTEAVGFDSENGKIVFTGKNNDALKRDYDVSIDLGGKLVIPAFTEGHAHLVKGAMVKAELNLRNAATRSGFANAIDAYRKNLKPDSWIYGGYFSETNFTEDFIINRDFLDEICPDIPLVISRLDLHSAVANSLAVKLSGVESKINYFAEDELITDSGGRLTGELKERAAFFVFSFIPELSSSDKKRILLNQIKYLYTLGITAVTDISLREDLDLYKLLFEEELLNLRINSVVPFQEFHNIENYKNEFNSFPLIRFGSFKAFYDGALSSESGLFKKPFIGSEYKGHRTDFVQSGGFRSAGIEIDKAGYQMIVHAIGDQAVSEVLDFARELASLNGNRDRRFRIEHAQHIDKSDIHRFKEYGVIASVQPSHLFVDAKTAAEKLASPESTHICKDIIKEGGVVCFGTDFPVASESPFETIYYAMTRRAKGFPGGFMPEYALSINECFEAYTINNAYASFEEKNRGSITTGKSADIVVLDADLFSVPAEEIKNAAAEMTFLGGERVF